VRKVDAPNDDRALSERQRQWRDWSAHGYKKRFQPTSMLWFGGVSVLLLIVGLVTLVYVAGRAGLP
jgi:hypothetical protein